MKRIFGTPRALAALLALSLLAGCGAQSGAGAATAETAAPAPTAAPQQLTVYYAGGADSPAATALRASPGAPVSKSSAVTPSPSSSGNISPRRRPACMRPARGLRMTSCLSMAIPPFQAQVACMSLG